MLLPGRDAEKFHKAVRSVSIPIQLPARRPASASGLAKVAHRLQKRRLTLGHDRVLDSHEDRSSVRLGVKGKSRLAPVNCRLAIEVTGLWNPPKDPKDDTNQHYGRRNKERQLQTEALRDESPDQCSHRHRASEVE